MKERKLVTLRTVSELRPIPDADAIETAVVDGWTCVVKKGEFKPGDTGIYFEIDSLLPLADERFAFLRKGAVGQEFHRLRTVKLRKQLSQGLLLKPDEFPECLRRHSDSDDLAEFIGVTKWEPTIPACLAGKVKGVFPSFIPKTDEERIQNMPWMFEDDEDGAFEVTIKLDGSSMTAFYKDGEFGVCSRNLQLVESDDNTFWQLAKKTNLQNALRTIGRNIAIQGELMGPGVQGNREGLKEHMLFVFNVFDIDKQQYYPTSARHNFLQLLAFHECTVQSVPYLGVYRLGAIGGMKEVIAFADGPSLNHKQREGVVFKRIDGKQSFKVISNQFLLAEK